MDNTHKCLQNIRR